MISKQMLIKKTTTTASCANSKCKKHLKKKDFFSKSIDKNKVLVCKGCGYYNSPEIFSEYVEYNTKNPQNKRVL